MHILVLINTSSNDYCKSTFIYYDKRRTACQFNDFLEILAVGKKKMFLQKFLSRDKMFLHVLILF